MAFAESGEVEVETLREAEDRAAAFRQFWGRECLGVACCLVDEMNLNSTRDGSGSLVHVPVWSFATSECLTRMEVLPKMHRGLYIDRLLWTSSTVRIPWSHSQCRNGIH